METQRSTVRVVDRSLVARSWLFGRNIVEYEQHGADRGEYGIQLSAKVFGCLRMFGIKDDSVTGTTYHE